MSDLVGRGQVLAEAAERLSAGRRVTVTGPVGIGRSAFLAAFACDGPLWRVQPTSGDRGVPLTGLSDLLAQLSRVGLAEPQREAVSRLLGATAGAPDPLALRQAALSLLGDATVVVDDAHLLDAQSAEVLDYVVHRSRARLLRSMPSGQSTMDDELPLPPLDPDQVALMLERHGLICRLAGRIHSASGGLPKLALEIGRTAAAASLTEHDPLRLTGRVTRLCQELLAPLSRAERLTLLHVALAERATIRLLRRAGLRTAEDDVAAARRLGLVSVHEDDRVVIDAGVVAIALVTGAREAERAAAHAALAEATDDEQDRLWHRASTVDGRDDLLARALAGAAAASRGRGNPVRAAELSLLAVGLAGPGIPGGELAAWLAEAAGAAGVGGRADLVRKAVARLESSGAQKADLARARLAVADAAGQALDGLDEMLARAQVEAAGHPELLAAIHLRLAWRANLTEGSPHNACLQARRAARHAQRAGDTEAETLALTMLARMQRILGDPAAESTLDEALSLSPVANAADLRNSPQYLALRHAVFDDRLPQARAGLLAMLPVAEASGVAEDLIDVLRSLAEVDIRSGRLAVGLARAARSIRVCEESGLSPGPSWYTAAVAELGGGTFARARAYAERAVRASEEEHDKVYLARALHVTGQIRLAGRDAAGAVEALRRVQALEQAQQVRDPSLLRWHGDLAESLVAVGAAGEGYQIIVNTRLTAADLGRSGVLAGLDRAEGVYHSAVGDPAHAVALLRRSEERFAELGMPLEQGRSLVALTVAERRRRHRAAARETQTRAEELFESIGAAAWAEAARITDTRRSEQPDSVQELTDAESKVVDLVAAGASNREIAATLFLSVKTVEAMLTRIYRRTGVRSRTQLCTLVTRAKG